MRARAHSYDGAAGLPAGEEDHRRDREHVVARGDARLLVHVHPRNLDRELLEDWLECFARAAPGRPEVDEHRRSGDRAVEGGLVELRHSLPLNASNRSAGTRVTASRKIALLIFDVPSVRSAKTIGT